MIGIAGNGAFGSALAIALVDGGTRVTLWGRDAEAMARLADTRQPQRLPDGVLLPERVTATADWTALTRCDTILLAVPAQKLRPFVEEHADSLSGKRLVACCKGIDMETLQGPTGSLRAAVPDATPAILTGPSFADDIARGLPTALTLACANEGTAKTLQQSLSTTALRLYTTTDVMGAELGGALKNVIAIGCGVTIGAGLGDSARAALLTRGFGEMQRLSAALGADPATLAGLSGLGDLTLTCTSDLSRNYRRGLALGRGEAAEDGVTVEGAHTAQAVERLAARHDLDLPVCAAIAGLVRGDLTVQEALLTLLTRPLKTE